MAIAMRTSVGFLASLATLGAGVAHAATNPPAVGTVQVTGHVAAYCVGGTVQGADSIFDVGVMIDTATGDLLPNLSAPPKVVIGSFCTSASTISITATPMVAQSFTGTVPTGFTDAVDYTATASGWTPTAATFTTDAATNLASTQTRDTAFTGPITVAVSGFTPVGGATLRPVADPLYQGLVTVTLAASV